MNKNIQFKQITPLEAGAITTGAFIGYFAAEAFIKEIKLRKDFNATKLKKVYDTPETTQECPELDISRIENSNYRTQIFKFINKMETSFTKSDLNNLRNNIKNVKIKRSFIAEMRKSSGCYAPGFNTIFIGNTLPQKYTTETLFHELLHMASTTIKNGVVYSGFAQVKNLYRIGIGLNEGYTQLLTERLDETSNMQTYEDEVRIAYSLEKIIGKDKMQELYFNTNLTGLIEEIGKLSSKEEATKFVMNVDYISKYGAENMKSSAHYKMIWTKYKEIYNILLKMYIKRKTEELKDKIITEDDFIDSIVEYINRLALNDGVDARMPETYSYEIINEALEHTKEKKYIYQKI